MPSTPEDCSTTDHTVIFDPLESTGSEATLSCEGCIGGCSDAFVVNDETAGKLDDTGCEIDAKTWFTEEEGCRDVVPLVDAVPKEGQRDTITPVLCAGDGEKSVWSCC